MRILLVDAFDPNGRVSSPASLGFGQIEAHMRSLGHTILTLNGMSDEQVTINKIIRFSPEIVGVSCVTDSRKFSFAIAKRIKEIFPDVPTIFGGIHPILFYQKLIQRDYIDAIVDGEGERAFEEIVNIYETHGSFKDIEPSLPIVTKHNYRNYDRNKVQEILLDEDKIRFIKHDRITKERVDTIFAKKMARLLTSWGCPYKCIYCASSRHLRGRFRQKSLNVLMEELEYLASIKVQKVNIIDDLLTVDLDRAKEFFYMIKKNGFKFSFFVKSRVDRIDNELFQLFEEAGVKLFSAGVESGSERMLKIMKRQMSLETIKTAFAMTKNFKFRTAANFIIGIPGETMQDYQLTMDLIKEIKPDSLQMAINRVYPNTQVYEMCLEKGYLSPDYFDDDSKISPFYSFEHNINELRKTAMKMYLEWLRIVSWPNRVRSVALTISAHGYPKILSFVKSGVRSKI